MLLLSSLALLTLATGCGDEKVCDADSEVGCVDWEAIAIERGFEARPDDFFEFLQSACVVDTVEPPSTLDQLLAQTDSVFVGHITEVVPVPDPNATLDDYDVELQVAVDDPIKGGLSGGVTLGTSCASAGKVAGLLYSMPSDSLLFFVNPSTQPETDDKYYLAYFYLGIVRDTETGPGFAMVGESAPTLDAYASLDELVADLR